MSCTTSGLGQTASPDRQKLDRQIDRVAGGGLQGDGVTEGLELPYQAVGLPVGVDASLVVVGAEVAVAGGGVGEQVPDDDQDGAGNGDQGFAFTAAFDDASVAFGEEGPAAAGGGGGGQAENAFEVRVALADLVGTRTGAGLDGAWAQPGPGHQMRGGGETGHVQADLGDDQLGGFGTQARYLGQALQRAGCGWARAVTGGVRR